MATLTFGCRGEGLGLLTASDSQDQASQRLAFPERCGLLGPSSCGIWSVGQGDLSRGRSRRAGGRQAGSVREGTGFVLRVSVGWRGRKCQLRGFAQGAAAGASRAGS